MKVLVKLEIIQFRELFEANKLAKEDLGGDGERKERKRKRLSHRYYCTEENHKCPDLDRVVFGSKFDRGSHEHETGAVVTCKSQRRALAIYYECVEECDRLCGLVVRVLGYRSGDQGAIPGTTRKNKVVGPERGPLSLVSTSEELLDRKVAAPV
jgi:hypothetical protein